MNAVTLDAGALIALDRDHRRMIALLAHATEIGARVTVPGTALAQAMRAPAKQARLSRLIRQPTTDVVPLDVADAVSVGVLLSTTRTSDITDAHVALCARRNRGAIVTSDPGDLARLAPGAAIVRI